MGYELPETINPPTVKFCIEVPDEESHLRAFWGAMWTLSRAYNWADDDDHTALEVGKVWSDLWWKNHEKWRERECMSGECLDELCDKVDKTNLLLDDIRSMIQGGFKLVPINGASNPPDLGGGDCAPDYFDHNTDETDPEVLEQRRKALCITVDRYIKGIMLQALSEMGAPDFLVDYVQSVIAADLPLEFSKLTVLYPYAFDGLSVFILMADTALSFEFLQCLMTDKLDGDTNNTFNNFKISIPESIDDIPAGLIPVADLLRRSNQSKENFTLFNEALNKANTEDLDSYECPCEPAPPSGCEIPLDIVSTFKPGFHGTITLVAPDIYHIFNDELGSGGGDRYLGAFEDANGQCFHVEDTGDPLYPGQAVGESDVHGCCGTADYAGIGGFGGNYIDVAWTNDTVIDTYYKITCVPPEECE